MTTVPIEIEHCDSLSNQWYDPWIFPPKIPTLQENEVHIWRAMLPKQKNIDLQLALHLSCLEQKQMHKYYFDVDKNRYAISRLALKQILSGYLNNSATTFLPNNIDNIVLHYTNYGKPYIEGSPLMFNLSHSGEYVVYAISNKSCIGIDVEYCQKNLDFLSIAKIICHENEYQKFRKTSLDEQVLAFYRLWTRKEAFAKAIGLGLHFPFTEIEVSFLANEDPALLAIHGLENQEPEIRSLIQGTWKMEEINLDLNYVATLVNKI